MILRKKVKIQNVVFLIILSISISEAIFLPIIVEGQRNNESNNYSLDLINDLTVRSRIIRK